MMIITGGGFQLNKKWYENHFLQGLQKKDRHLSKILVATAEGQKNYPDNE